MLARMEAVARENDDVRDAAQQPIVDSWTCLRAFVAAYENACGELTSYAARHSLYVPHQQFFAAQSIQCWFRSDVLCMPHHPVMIMNSSSMCRWMATLCNRGVSLEDWQTALRLSCAGD